MTKYYTYILINSQDNQPFYVGKGAGSRMYQHLKEAQRDDLTKRSVHSKIMSILQKGGKVLYNKFDMETENAAFEEEKRLIALYGRKDIGTGILCNLTEGGEGASNQSPEAIEKRAAKHRGMKRSDEAKQHMREAQLIIKAEMVEKYGQKRSPESILKQSAKTKGTKWSENARSVKRDKPTAKAVLVYKKDTEEFVGEWESMALCAKELSLDVSSIWKILSGRLSKAPDGKMRPYRSHKGYTFAYK